MENFLFTEEEIRNELANFGYNNLPNDTIAQFKKDLQALMKPQNVQSDDSSRILKSFNENVQLISIEKRDKDCGNISRKVSRIDNASRSSISVGKEYFYSDSLLSERSPVIENNHVRRKVCSISSRESLPIEPSSDDSNTSEILSVLGVGELQPIRDVQYRTRIKTGVPSSSVIKSTGGEQRSKCDPVRRYHEYRRFWNEFPTPGEERRNQLRWGIREKMNQFDSCPTKKLDN